MDVKVINSMNLSYSQSVVTDTQPDDGRPLDDVMNDVNDSCERLLVTADVMNALTL